MDVVKKYVDSASPVAEKLVEQLKSNIKLSNVRVIKIEGTNAQGYGKVRNYPEAA